jgi:hypothetical protein
MRNFETASEKRARVYEEVRSSNVTCGSLASLLPHSGGPRVKSRPTDRLKVHIETVPHSTARPPPSTSIPVHDNFNHLIMLPLAATFGDEVKKAWRYISTAPRDFEAWYVIGQRQLGLCVPPVINGSRLRLQQADPTSWETNRGCDDL